MKTILLLSLTCLLFIDSDSQTLESSIKQIHNAEQAWRFIKAHPKLHGQVLDFKSVADSSTLAKLLLQQHRGALLKKDKFLYKILWDTSATFSKVSYIYLNGQVLSIKQIDSLRSDIIDQYNKGTSFSQLASIYTMDQNPTGELDWFLHGYMAPEFAEAINQHTKGEVFTADVPSRKWYYVVKKTHDSQQGREVVVLKLQNQ